VTWLLLHKLVCPSLPLRIGLQGDMNGNMMPMPLLLNGMHNAAAGWLSATLQAVVCAD